MNRTIKIVMWTNLAVIAVLAFMYPHLMISPGKLIPDHRNLEQDCFACHTPLIGAQSSKCVECHTVKDIGILTTKGKPIITPASKSPVPFHQKLIEQECIACHSDHTGVIPFRKNQGFSHSLLQTATRDQCISCHKMPGDKVHNGVPENCAQCHTQEKWKPATFKHDLLAPWDLEKCISCHKPVTPKDKVHERGGEKCGTCHKTDKWKPASFKHDLLPPQELEQCISCHKPQTPKDKVHERGGEKCGLCHKTDKWKPATFKHDLLPPQELEQCISCHKPQTPKDKVHERGGEKCGTCHKTDKWKPASFKHELLPRAELRQCKTCHAKETPNDQRHRESSGRCGNCHYTDKWEPAKKAFGTSRASTPSSGTTFTKDPNWWRKNRNNDD